MRACVAQDQNVISSDCRIGIVNEQGEYVTANDLLLWLWRRDAGPVEILGDVAVAERFRSFPDL